MTEMGEGVKTHSKIKRERKTEPEEAEPICFSCLILR